MGLHIAVYRINGDVAKELPFEEWDWYRYSGDRDFASSEADLLQAQYFPDHDDWYYRPQDFEVAAKWVRDNIFENGQQRFITILNRMQKEPDLYFYLSY